MRKMPVAGAIIIFIVAITNATKAQPGNTSAVVSIHAKALKHFTKTYKNATDIKWSGLNNGTAQVYCVNKGIQTTIFYNGSGHREGMLRYYGASKLPLRVQHKIRSNYQNFTIFQTIEVTIGKTIAWLVTIQDATCWKTIRVMDNEMTLVKELQKS